MQATEYYNDRNQYPDKLTGLSSVHERIYANRKKYRDDVWIMWIVGILTIVLLLIIVFVLVKSRSTQAGGRLLQRAIARRG
jgi:hypothetical protein